MDITHPVTLTSLDHAFQDARQKAQSEYDWYENRKKFYIAGSWAIRILTAMTIALGIILPITKKSAPVTFYFFDGPAAAGYAFLVIAVVILALDHVFMFSRSWVRYVNAISKIKTLILTTEYEWLKLRTGIADDAAAHEQREKAFDLFKTLIHDTRKVVDDETAAWGTELNQALQKLEGLVKEQRATVEQWTKEERKAQEETRKAAEAPTAGGISVEIEKSENLSGTCTVQVDDESKERPVPIQKVIFPRVVPGHHGVLLKATDKSGNSFRAEELVIVQPNKVEVVKFTIPEPRKTG